MNAGWTMIPCSVLELSALDAELAEIDENLCRHELSTLERAECLARRKKLYEAKFPQAKHGGDRVSNAARDQVAESAVCSFATDTATRTGTSERTVREDVQIATSIPDGGEAKGETISSFADDTASKAGVAGGNAGGRGRPIATEIISTAIPSFANDTASKIGVTPPEARKGGDRRSEEARDQTETVSVCSFAADSAAQATGMNRAVGNNVSETISPTFAQDTASKKHPETKAGVAGGLASGESRTNRTTAESATVQSFAAYTATSETISFAADTASRTGVTPPKFPETRAGVAGGKASGEARGDRTSETISFVPSFASDTASKIGAP